METNKINKSDQPGPKMKVAFPDGDHDLIDVYDSDSASGETNNTSTTSDMTGHIHNNSSSGFAKEERWVLISRWLVFSVMVAAATLVGVETFRISTKQQQDNFINDYYSTAEEILEESEIRTANAFATIYTMSITATTLVQSIPSMRWPFVGHLPSFESWAGGINLELTGALSLGYGVLVAQGQEQEWSQHYAKFGKNFTTFSDGETFDETHDDHEEDFTPFIWRYAEGDDNSKRKSQVLTPLFGDHQEYAVLAQNIPYQTSAINHDEYELSMMSTLIEGMKHDQQGVMSDMFVSIEEVHPEHQDHQGSTGAIGNNEDENETSQRYSSFFLQPIFAELLETENDDDDEGDDALLAHASPSNHIATNRTMVGYLKAELPWDHYFFDLLPEGAKGIQLVISTQCNGVAQAVTYELVSDDVVLLGEGDLHDPTHEHMVVEEQFNPFKVFTEGGLESSSDEDEEKEAGNSSDSDDSEEEDGEEESFTSGCAYRIQIYPSDVYRQQYRNNRPAVYTALGVIVILCTAMVFMVYDWFVKQRQRKLVANANRTNAIVNSLFPSTVRDRLFEHKMNGTNGNGGEFGDSEPAIARNFHKVLRQTFTNKGLEKHAPSGLHIRPSKPIADLFASVTVMFADFNGFTAWSSVREPSQVFVLLEAVYDSFDKIAKRRGIFKVETIGDCYVAASGLPVPRHDHAESMSRFATECLGKMLTVVKSLEVLLGPGTEELGMRFGLHSGQVMAGVLRGEKSRFQLFGDTVNTASRIETTGERNKIHISSQTADHLIAAKKSHWIKPRSTKVLAKGKGELQTYWLVTDAIVHHRRQKKPRKLHEGMPPEQPIRHSKSSETSSSVEDDPPSPISTGPKGTVIDNQQDKMERLVDYNTEVLLKLLKKMVAMRSPKSISNSNNTKNKSKSNNPVNNLPTTSPQQPNHAQPLLPLDEVKEIITLPSEPSKYLQDPELVVLPKQVVAQLRDYVETIASMYHTDNFFHSFEHASHVTMSVTKLLSRIVTSSDSIDYTSMTYNTEHQSKQEKDIIAEQHRFTYGITSDPLTQFAVAFAALIHDVDHPGVPNTTLIQEGSEIATTYNNQSVAEQNSVDIAWSLLMESPYYDDLRHYIYSSNEEQSRFRQLVVNCVMATDIIDKDLGKLRKERWSKAFESTSKSEEKPTIETVEDVNRKATIVIEHLIQASDVAHTMQHWHVYLKWNKKLFMEMYAAYKAGRGAPAVVDPSLNWFTSELSFFDYYIIPLAKKLEECGVFGVSSDEYLDYAVANRNEFERKGHDIVRGYIEEAEASIMAGTVGA